MTRFIRSI